MASRQAQVLTLLANILLGAAILIFAIGFFPYKAVLPGLASWDTETKRTHAPFDKVVFMVVDALRSDFVYGPSSRFLYTQSLIRSGAAIPFTGHASPPTITMPKVKAITTGSVPSFIDLILNFAESDTTSTLASQDSWLAQLKAKPEGKLVMYGDDTWLRLFPGFFERSDGTTSFFVSDFTEVDQNVTRNVPDALKESDWNGMVLHYLGLDHIGHKTGPLGPNMPAKQEEMDEIVKQIYQAMEEQTHLQSTLLVLLGDHGMNEAGNHGASSSGETSTALTFISPKFKNIFAGFESPVYDVTGYKYYDVVQQSDIAATLAALMGFPIPKNSLGFIIPRLLELWSDEKDKFDMLYSNAEQIQRIAQATFPDAFDESALASCHKMTDHNDERRVACAWQDVVLAKSNVQQGTTDSQLSFEVVNTFLQAAQSLLSTTASKYDLNKMGIAIGLVALSVLLSIFSIGGYIAASGASGIAFVLLIVIYSITMFASSYVEEEQQFWYWATAGWFVYLITKARRFSSTKNSSSLFEQAAICILFGIGRRWNQTGQKYAGDPDLITEVLSHHPWLLWSLIMIAYAILSRRLSARAAKWGTKRMGLLPVLVTISAFVFKLCFTAADAPELLQGIKIFDSVITFASRYTLNNIVRVVFYGLVLLIGNSILHEQPWKSRSQKQKYLLTLHDLVSLLLITQSRTANIPIFLIFYVQASYLQKESGLQQLELTVTSLLLQYSSFFAFGGTNAISSVDLSNAYNGVSTYNVLAVGCLTFASNWAGPIWWSSATSCLLSMNSSSEKNKKPAPKSTASRTSSSTQDDEVTKSPSSTEPNEVEVQIQIDSPTHYALLTLFTTTTTLSVMLSCFLLREHLFIWTVFSPKYLYIVAWIFGQHFVINGLFGCLILGNNTVSVDDNPSDKNSQTAGNGALGGSFKKAVTTGNGTNGSPGKNKGKKVKFED